jgi:tetratricopeptide (TPR) repeat protein
MRLILLALAASACLQAAGDPRAVDEANAAVAFAREGKYELAVAKYKAALKLDPALPGLRRRSRRSSRPSRAIRTTSRRARCSG